MKLRETYQNVCCPDILQLLHNGLFRSDNNNLTKDEVVVEQLLFRLFFSSSGFNNNNITTIYISFSAYRSELHGECTLDGMVDGEQPFTSSCESCWELAFGPSCEHCTTEYAQPQRCSLAFWCLWRRCSCFTFCWWGKKFPTPSSSLDRPSLPKPSIIPLWVAQKEIYYWVDWIFNHHINSILSFTLQ